MSTETANFLLDSEAYLLVAIQVGCRGFILAGTIVTTFLEIKKVAARRHRGAP